MAVAALVLRTSPCWGAILYVNVNNPSPAWPYDDWSTAATTIQDAVDAAVNGDQVLVVDGVYNTGSRIVNGLLDNRVVIDKSITVQSVNGPANTVIEGYQIPGTINGDGAARCVYLTTNATLIGFTLTNGATRTAGTSSEKTGGGAYCRASSSVLSNCVIVANAAATSAGGVYRGTLYNCTLLGNRADNGGGTSASTLINSWVGGNRATNSGGGASSATLNNCTLITNSAATGGGGYSCNMTNCTLSGNTAGYGGGSDSGTLRSCTLTGNVASIGGGARSGTLIDCILTTNAADSGGGAYSTVSMNCTFDGNTATGSGGGANGGSLTNCTLTGNSAAAGGGINSATSTRCKLIGNIASGLGGGAISGTLRSCMLTRNSAGSSGGGAYYSSLYNCTLTANSAIVSGGGADSSTAYNCVLYYNSAAIGPNWNGYDLNYSCTTPLPASGVGNLGAQPLLADSFRLTAGSPCRGGGSTNYATGLDIDGEAWAKPPSMGCDEFNGATATGPLSVGILAAYTNVAAGFPLNFFALIIGAAGSNQWSFGDGITASNRPQATHAWNLPGTYAVVLRAYNNSNPGGISSTVTVQVVEQPVHYVSLDSQAPLTPYASWNTAATDIQDAIDAVTVPGALVLVADGVYSTGGKIVLGALTNRVAVDRPLVLRSVHGPALSTIQGYQVPAATNGDSAVRCVYLCERSALIGFTVTGGGTRAAGDLDTEQSGGGAWCAGSSVVVSNCVITGNASADDGGGVFSGTLFDCTITGNSSAISGGGVYTSTLTNCTLTANAARNGAGVAYSTLQGCTLEGNAGWSGGGAYASALFQCVLKGNSGLNSGGGIYSSTANDCSFVTNSAPGATGGGSYSSSLTNCTLTGNTAAAGGGAGATTLQGCTLTANTASQLAGGASDSTLINCTVATNSAPDGGGIYGGTTTNCLLVGNFSATGGGARAATLHNSKLIGNSASSEGGGAATCTLYNCVLNGNSADVLGGGASLSWLDNCTVTGNSAIACGGGLFAGGATNSIVFYNSAAAGANHNGSTIHYSCTTPLPTAGVGNVTAEPLLADSFRLSLGSPCRGAGSSAFVVGTDFDGEAWANPPSMGADEFRPETATGALAVSIRAEYTNVAAGFPADFSATITGSATANFWDFGDGTIVSNRPFASHAWALPGNYAVVFRVFNNTIPSGSSTTILVHVVTQPVHYVAAGNLSPQAPYSSWARAAASIQDAVDAATVAGALLLVGNGNYDSGGKALYAGLSNRVAATMPVVLKSVNGPEVTMIHGSRGTGGPATRCAYLSGGSRLIGFTLTNGVTGAGYSYLENSGASLWCAAPSVLVSNCVVAGSSFANYDTPTYVAGGVFGGTLQDCTLSGNAALQKGGGAYCSTLNHCVLTGNSVWGDPDNGAGGGAYGSVLNHCLVTTNSSAWSGAGVDTCVLNDCVVMGNNGPGMKRCFALRCTSAENTSLGAQDSTLDISTLRGNGSGGAYSCTLSNCLLTGNSRLYNMGGGASYSTLYNCTVVSNVSSYYGGGVYFCSVFNSIVYNNAAPGSNFGSNWHGSSFNYSCTFPAPTNGVGNLTNDPGMVNWTNDFQLRPDSPCVNSGSNAWVWSATDLAGKLRKVGGAVDLGAFELQTPGYTLPFLWAQSYRLTTDGSIDSDADGLNNWQEWIAGTNPTNAASVLILQGPVLSAPGVLLRWTSVAGQSYFLERAINFGATPAFALVQTNIAGLSGTTSFTDTNVPPAVTVIYRVGVQQ